MEDISGRKNMKDGDYVNISLHPKMNSGFENFEDGNISGSNSSRTEFLVPADLDVVVRVSLYMIIFILSVVGNSLVILTLVQNKRMRTVTNVFLLNLATSDLLLSVLCMPFTLTGSVLQNWIFGKFLCTTLPFLQAVSVGVSVFTLVAISLERYFAICYPLQSRSWQTLSHAYKTIAVVWVLSTLVSLPIAFVQQLQPLSNGRHRCRENWRSDKGALVYTLFLDSVLFVIPLIVMLVAYSLIAHTLWQGIKLEEEDMRAKQNKRNEMLRGIKKEETYSFRSNGAVNTRSGGHRQLMMRKSVVNTEKQLNAKKRVIKMLFVVVLEFFICWAPLYTTFTMYTLDQIYTLPTKSRIKPLTFSLILLLAYASSCTNPITYCFMNKKYRQAFISVCCCGKKKFVEEQTKRHTETSSVSISLMRHSTTRITNQGISNETTTDSEYV